MNVVTVRPVPLRLTFCMMCALAISVSIAAQNDDGLRARQLYYKSKSAIESEQKLTADQKTATTIDEQGGKSAGAGKATTASKHHVKSTDKPANAAADSEPAASGLGMKYAIEQGDASGKYVQVDPDSTFSTGDVIRLRMEVNTDAYVYLLTRGASGEGNFLFPEPGENNRLKAFQSVQVPATGDPIRFDEPAGTETLFVLVSRTPVADFEKALPARGSAIRAGGVPSQPSEVSSAEFRQFTARADAPQSRDLVRGKVHPGNGSAGSDLNEHAVYAVNVSAAPGARILQKIELKHR